MNFAQLSNENRNGWIRQLMKYILDNSTHLKEVDDDTISRLANLLQVEMLERDRGFQKYLEKESKK